MKDYYKILQVPRSASRKDIESNYKKIFRKYSTDKENKYARLLELIHEAYSILSDPYTRGRYDEKLEHTSFIDDMRLDSILPDIDSMFNSSPNTKSYSYSSQSHYINNNGKVHTKVQTNINDNGKNKSYTKETLDGKIIKEKGDKSIQERYRLIK